MKGILADALRAACVSYGIPAAVFIDGGASYPIVTPTGDDRCADGNEQQEASTGEGDDTGAGSGAP